MLALIGISLWIVGTAILYIIYKSGRFELYKLVISAFISGGIFLIVMQIFASIAYSSYIELAVPSLSESFKYMVPLFDYKILISSIASILGILAAALAWSPNTRGEVKASLIISSIVIVMFFIDLLLAAWVMTTVSV